jgi:hypothetical protein
VTERLNRAGRTVEQQRKVSRQRNLLLATARKRAMDEMYRARRTEGYELYRAEADAGHSPPIARGRALGQLAARYPDEFAELYEKHRAEIGWTAAPDGRSRARK